MTAIDRDPLPTEQQRQLLCELLAEALIDIRSADVERGQALAYALHNLPRTMYGWGTWSVEGQRRSLAYFQTQHPGGPDYATLFTAIMSRR